MNRIPTNNKKALIIGSGIGGPAAVDLEARPAAAGTRVDGEAAPEHGRPPLFVCNPERAGRRHHARADLLH